MQLVEWTNGRLVVREHLGSAHTPGELAALIEVAKQRIQGDQQALDLELSERGAAVIDVPALEEELLRRTSDGTDYPLTLDLRRRVPSSWGRS